MLRLLSCAALVGASLTGSIRSAQSWEERFAEAVPAIQAGVPTRTLGDATMRACAGVSTPEGDEVWCGNVAVPLDYADPDGDPLILGFEWYPASAARPDGTIVALAGGPGGSVTSQRDSYLAIFTDLLDQYNLLLVDTRGTGRSEAIDCSELEGYHSGEDVSIEDAVTLCAEELDTSWRDDDGSYRLASGLFTTANAARDLDRLLGILGLDRVHVFGSSYGTLLALGYASRYQERVETLTLDSPYVLDADDPFGTRTLASSVTAATQVCDDSPHCGGAIPPTSVSLGLLLEQLRESPIEGATHDADGAELDWSLYPEDIIWLFQAAGYDPSLLREFDAAVRAAVNGDPVPLLRLSVLGTYGFGPGDVTGFSQGTFTAVSCADHPQPFDMSQPQAARRTAYIDRVGLDEADLEPFTADEWLSAQEDNLRMCLTWPTLASDREPAVLEDQSPFGAPTLVLSGELDSVTPSSDAERIAAKLGSAARWVELRATGHPAALSDQYGCAMELVTEFIRRPDRLKSMGASCADVVPPIRTVSQFPRSLADVTVTSGSTKVSDEGLRLAAVAAWAAADVVDHMWYLTGDTGVGLRGGSYTVDWGDEDVATVQLDRVRFTEDVSVSGTVTWDYATWVVDGELVATGPDGLTGDIGLHFDDYEWSSATLTGTVGGGRLSAAVPIF